MTKNRIAVLTCGAIFLASFFYYLSYYKYLPLTGDEGHLINGAMRVLDGQLPLKDFYQTYAPARYWGLALLFRLFGPSLIVERFLWVIVHSLTNVLMYLAARRSTSARFAAIPLLTMMVIPGIWNKTLCGFLILANLLVIYRYLERFDRVSLALCGVAAGFTVWVRQDIGGYAALAMLACLFGRSVLRLRSSGGRLATRVQTEARRVTADLLTLSTPIALSLLPLVLLYWLRSGLYQLVRGMTIGRIRSVFTISSPFPSPLLILSSQNTKPPRTEIIFLYALLLMLAALTLLVLIQAARRFWNRESRYNWVLFSTLILTILLVRGHIHPFAHMYRLPQDGAPIYILGGYVMWGLYSNVSSSVAGRTGSRAAGSVVGITIILPLLVFQTYYVGYSLLAQSTMAGGIPVASGPYLLIESSRAGTSLPEIEATNLNEVMDYITAHTDAQDTIFAFNTPQLYFLTERRNATRQDKINPSLAEPWAEQELVDDLRKNEPALILVTPSEARRYLIALHTLRDEIVQNYQLDSTIGTTYIFRRGTTLSSPFSSLGLVYEIAGAEEEALAQYRNALTIDPQDEVARGRLALLHFRQGNTYRSTGQMQAALAAYEAAVTLEPSNAQIHEALGRLYREQNLLPEATAELERAVELDPTRASAYRGLGLIYERLGRPQEAVAAYQEAAALYERAVDLDPADAGAYEGLGLTYEQLGRIEEAVSAYQEAARLDPSSAQTHEQLGRMYREQGQLQGAAAEYEKAVALDPMRPSAYWGLGQTYERLGRFQDAIAAYHEVVRIDPANQRAQRGLEQLSVAGAEDIDQPFWRSFAGAIALLGYDVQPKSLRAGQTVYVTLWWEALAGMDRDYTVFIHLVGPDDRIWAQQDRLLVRSVRRTSEWPAGWIARKGYELGLPPDAPSGWYVVKVGIYYWETGERLPVWDGSRQRSAEDAIALEAFAVGE